MIVSPGSTDVKTYYMMRLTADGTAATGLTPANFDLQYTRSGAAAAAKVDATLNGNGVGGAHSDSTVIEVDATNSPGLYRVDWPDAAFVAGEPEVICTVKVATAFTEPLRVELKALNETARAALEDQYDGTGLVGDPFPLRQDQGASISGGLAVHETATSVTVIQGEEQGLADTGASNNTRWTGDDVGAGAEFIFRFVPSDTDSEPGDLHFEGFYAEPGAPFTNSATVETYNFSLAQWDVQETLTNSSVDETHDDQLSNAYRSPNSDTIETVVVTPGDVLVKFQQTSQETGNAVLNVDKITVGFISSPLTASEIVDEWETQSQEDPTGFHVNVLEVNGTGQTANDNGADINTILIDVAGLSGEAMRGTDGALKPTVASRTLNVTSTGAGGIDWGSMENKGATVALTSTSIGLTEVARSSITGGEYPISTNDGGFVRIADGTATGEINTNNGAIALVDVTTTVTDDVTTDGASRTASKATSVTVSDKTGFKLASDGLDSISTTEPAGVASNFREMLVQTWRRFFKKATMTSTQIKTYDDATTGVVTTQTVEDNGTTQTQGEAN